MGVGFPDVRGGKTRSRARDPGKQVGDSPRWSGVSRTAVQPRPRQQERCLVLFAHAPGWWSSAPPHGRSQMRVEARKGSGQGESLGLGNAPRARWDARRGVCAGRGGVVFGSRVRALLVSRARRLAPTGAPPRGSVHCPWPLGGCASSARPSAMSGLPHFLAFDNDRL